MPTSSTLSASHTPLGKIITKKSDKGSKDDYRSGMLSSKEWLSKQRLLSLEKRWQKPERK